MQSVAPRAVKYPIMLPRNENDLLTQAGPGKPLGALMRLYWIPALLSEEISEPNSPPVRVRLLGEDLVAFRDSQGRVGLLDEHCSHRGTSLYFGRNEECGLRCIYHGWKYDVDGNVLETPAEPAGSTLKNKVHHTAYPCKEAAGIVWSYLGPNETVPLLPNYEWMNLPPDNLYVSKSMQDCSWLQGLEGECDSSHLSILHQAFYGERKRAGGDPDMYAADAAPTLEGMEIDYGMRMISCRKADRGHNLSAEFPTSSCPATDLSPPAGSRAMSKATRSIPTCRSMIRHSMRYNIHFRRNRPIRTGRKTTRPRDCRRLREGAKLGE